MFSSKHMFTYYKTQYEDKFNTNIYYTKFFLSLYLQQQILDACYGYEHTY